MPFNTLIKAIEILDLFIDKKTSLSAGDISDLLNMPRSTTYKYLAILIKNRFLGHDSKSGQYNLGFRFFEFGIAAQAQFAIDKIALPFMQKLFNEVKETVILSALINDKAYCLEKVGNESGIVFVMQRGSHLPLHCGASALILLALWDKKSAESFLEKAELKQYTDNTITDPVTLRKRLADIRKAGYAYSDQEVDIGGRAVAAPIFYQEGKVAASLGVVGPIQRMSNDRIEEIKELVINYANEITKKLANPANQ